MSDSKLNNKFHDAVRAGGRGAARGAGAASRAVRSTWKKMRLWQKAGLVLCVVFWISSVILGAVFTKITGGLVDQNAAERWSSSEGYAQISSFMADGSGGSEETVKAMYSGLMMDLQQASIALSETQEENGASLIETCYCGMGSADLTRDTENVTVNAIGVGGDFFNFHPLDLIDGYYFADDDLMKDRILIDDQTAWRLFGSPNVIGMSLSIGGTPHYIAGVFRQPRDRFYKESGMGSYLIYMSYDSLCKYTEASVSGEEGGTTDDTNMDVSENLDAFVPNTESGQVSAEEPAIPRTAAYMPENREDSTGKKAALSDLDESAEAGDDGGEGLDTDSVKEEVAPDKDEELNDDPVGENLGPGNGSGTMPGSGQGGEDEDDENRVTVNRNRITCYEAVIPNPVKGFALSRVRSRLEQISFSMDNVTVVDNTNRYDVIRLISLLAQPGVRSMQTAAIRYPYWENVALAWEDVLIPFALLWMILRYSPLLFLLWLLIWYATHKSWTVGGVISDIQGRIYDRQSERIYGKASAGALPLNDPEAIDADSEKDEGENAADTEALADEEDSPVDTESLPESENPAEEGDFASESGAAPEGRDTDPEGKAAADEPDTEPESKSAGKAPE